MASYLIDRIEIQQGSCVSPSRYQDDTPPPSTQSPRLIEDGFYQPLPPLRWYQKLIDSLNPMPLQRRTHPYPHQRFISERTRGPTNSISKHDFDVRELRLPDNGELSRLRRSLVITIIKNAVLCVPILVLCLFGIMHIVQWGIGGTGLFTQSDDPDFLPDWGQSGHMGDGLAHYPTDATRDIIALPIHSHNDYWRRIPLFEALHYGCTGVEADVWYLNGDLFVGHSTSALTSNRTFKSLYVDPLIELLDKQNPTTEFGKTSRHGVFDTDPDQTLVLLVDIKTDGPTTFPIVEAQLEGLRSKGYLTYFNGTHTIPGAITVVGTGETPFDMLISNTTYRDIFYDAPLDLLRESAARQHTKSDGLVEDILIPSKTPSTNIPLSGGQGKTGLPANISADAFNTSTSYYASLNFKRNIGFAWRGKLSHKQLHTLRGQIRAAKSRGLKVRYWNTPKWPISLRNHVWHSLVQEGADMLNVDDLQAAAAGDWRRWKHQWW